MTTERKKVRRRVVTPRELLLVEVERYCRDASCGALTRVGLTKSEARVYREFTCARCERAWDDSLSERDVPEWWDELQITSLGASRALGAGARPEEDDDGGVVARLSDAWRAGGAEGDDDGGAS